MTVCGLVWLRGGWCFCTSVFLLQHQWIICGWVGIELWACVWMYVLVIMCVCVCVCVCVYEIEMWFDVQTIWKYLSITIERSIFTYYSFYKLQSKMILQTIWSINSNQTIITEHFRAHPHLWQGLGFLWISGQVEGLLGLHTNNKMPGSGV